METITLVKELHTANHWANETLLKAIPENLFEIETKGSFPSIKATANHIWDAQYIWYSRFAKNASTALPSKSFSGNHTEYIAGVLKSSADLIQLLETKDENWLTEHLQYTNLQGKEFSQPHYQLMVHLTHHSAMHRGQIITYARQLGYGEKIPQTDVVAWYRLQ